MPHLTYTRRRNLFIITKKSKVFDVIYYDHFQKKRRRKKWGWRRNLVKDIMLSSAWCRQRCMAWPSVVSESILHYMTTLFRSVSLFFFFFIDIPIVLMLYFEGNDVDETKESVFSTYIFNVLTTNLMACVVLIMEKWREKCVKACSMSRNDSLKFKKIFA